MDLAPENQITATHYRTLLELLQKRRRFTPAERRAIAYAMAMIAQEAGDQHLLALTAPTEEGKHDDVGD